MKRIATSLFLFLASLGAALAQSSPGLIYGQVPTPAQWNSYFIAKQDTLGYTPVNKAGDVMTGKLVTVPPTTLQAGFNLPPGAAPTSPINGDMWSTSVGIFIRVSGTTIGPLIGAGAGTFAAVSPLAVTFPSSVVTYAFDFSVANTFTGLQTFSAGIRPSTTAIGGATIGGNALAVTGTSLFNSAVTMSAALTYGGVTLSNAVTGTGAMVLASAPSIASPTLTGTVAGTNVIPFSVLAQGSALSVLGVTGNAGANLASITGTANQVLRLNSAGTALTFGSIDLSQSATVGATILTGTNGGTGVNNGAFTQTISGNVVQAGAFTRTFTATATTNSTLPAGTHTLAGLDVVQLWNGVQSFAASNFQLNGAVSGTLVLNCANTCGSSNITFPAGTTNFSATGGASQVVKQVSSGAAFTVGQLATTDLATISADFVVGNFTGGTASPGSAAIVNCANALTYSTSTHSFGCNATAGTGTVTSVVIANGAGITVSGTCTITTTGTCTIANAGIGNIVLQTFCAAGLGCTTTCAAGGTCTYTPSANLIRAELFCQAGGGGGGGTAATATNNASAGSGGGSGGWSKSISANTSNQTVSMSTPGAGGAAGNNAGAASTDASIGAIVIAKGGSGGTGAASSPQAGGIGGIAGTGDIKALGGTGIIGSTNWAGLSNIIGAGGNGANSPMGGGGTGASNTGGAAGGAATGFGAGGGGAMSANGASAAGGAGSGSYCYALEYIKP